MPKIVIIITKCLSVIKHEPTRIIPMGLVLCKNRVIVASCNGRLFYKVTMVSNCACTSDARTTVTQKDNSLYRSCDEQPGSKKPISGFSPGGKGQGEQHYQERVQY